jgi:hypothetical protein
MTKFDRLIYVELAREVDAEICCFCKYSQSLGCGEGSACTHTLDEKYELLRVTDDIQSDCWAFRPCMSISLISDIVGIILSKHWENWAFHREGEQVKVFGRTLQEELDTV